MADRKSVTVLFVEPSAFDFDDDYIEIDVPQALYQEMINGGRVYSDDRGKAYLFGKMFDLDDYYHPGFHTVVHGTTGFLSSRLATKKDRDGKKTRDFEVKHGVAIPDDRGYIQRMALSYPEIKWIGSVPSSVKSAHLHYHVNPKTDLVDSVIVDMEYFYVPRYSPSESDSGSDEGSQESSHRRTSTTE